MEVINSVGILNIRKICFYIFQYFKYYIGFCPIMILYQFNLKFIIFVIGNNGPIQINNN